MSRRVETQYEKEMREKNMKVHQKRIKDARKKGNIRIEKGPDLSHVHHNLKKKQMKRDSMNERNWHNRNTKRRMDEYVSTIDNDGEYLLEWLKLLQQLRNQKDFDVSSKYKNIHSLYMQIMKELPDFDINNLPDQQTLVKLIKDKNPDLFKKLIKASTPKKRRRRRRKSGKSPGRGRGRRRRRGSSGKKKGGKMLNRLDVEGSKTDEDSSSDDDGKPRIRRRRRSRSMNLPKKERDEKKERQRFLKAFLPTHMQVDMEEKKKQEEEATKKEKEEGEEGKENEKKSSIEEDVIILEKIDQEQEKEKEEEEEEEEKETEKEKENDESLKIVELEKPKKTELETELEVKMAKEIWGFVFNHVKKRETGDKIGGGNKSNRTKGDPGNGSTRGGGRNKDGSWNNDISSGGRRKRGGFSGPNMNSDDINNYSGDEEDEEDYNRRQRRSKNSEKKGDIDEYSGDEEDGIGGNNNNNRPKITITTTRAREDSDRRKRNKKKPSWNNAPSQLQANKYGFTEEDLKSAVTPKGPSDETFDWGVSPIPRGRKPQFSDYWREKDNGDEEEDGEVKRHRPSSSYSELEVDRGLVIENLSEYEFIGISMIWLKALSHSSHMFLFTPVISILDHAAGLCKGGIWGHMKCGVVPTDHEGKWLVNHHVHAVENPDSLIGRPYHFKLRIESLKGDIVKRITDTKTENDSSTDVVDKNEGVRTRKVNTALFVKYQMDYIKDQRITDVCERISRRSDDVKEEKLLGKIEEGVLFHFEKDYCFPYVTPEILFFLRNNAVRFEIYMKKKYLEVKDVSRKKTLFSI